MLGKADTVCRADRADCVARLHGVGIQIIGNGSACDGGGAGRGGDAGCRGSGRSDGRCSSGGINQLARFASGIDREGDRGTHNRTCQVAVHFAEHGVGGGNAVLGKKSIDIISADDLVGFKRVVIRGRTCGCCGEPDHFADRQLAVIRNAVDLGDQGLILVEINSQSVADLQDCVTCFERIGNDIAGNGISGDIILRGRSDAEAGKKRCEDNDHEQHCQNSLLHI